MREWLKHLALLVLVVAGMSQATADTVWAGFTDQPNGQLATGAVPAPWRVVPIRQLKPTEYQAMRWDGVNAVQAQADASMALLAREIQVDLSRTPVLCWRWRVENLIEQANMLQKSGDDYPARVYVAFSISPQRLGMMTRAQLKLARAIYGGLVPDAAINYVWDNRQPVGMMQPNVYTDRTHMKVQRSGSAMLGRWVNERVDVWADVQRAFGPLELQDVRLNLLAVATDTDNTAQRARAGFAELHFVGANLPCEFSSP